MTTMKTSELTGMALDWAVAKCEGRSLGVMTDKEQAERFMRNSEVNPSPEAARAYASIVAGLKAVLCSIDPEDGYKAPLHLVNSADYSTDWAQGGPIIEREKVSVQWASGCWAAIPDRTNYPNCDAPYFYGPTPLIAAMRCYVASKLGNTVEIPAELA